MTGEAQQRKDRLKGIGLVCVAVAMFACLDATTKYLNTSMHPVQIVWARYAGGLALWLIVDGPVSSFRALRTTRPWLQTSRGMLLAGSSLVTVTALIWVRLDQMTAILFSTPFIVTIMSAYVFGERFGWRRWTAIFVGFFGVLVITRPGLGGIHPAGFLIVLTVLMYSIYLVATRLAARTDSNKVSLMYANFVGSVMMTLIVPFFWTTPQTWFEVGLMVMLGVVGSTGHYLLIIANRLAPPAILTPFFYLQLIWVVIISVPVFGVWPDHFTIVGAAIVIGSGLYLLHREHVRGRRTVSESLAE